MKRKNKKKQKKTLVAVSALALSAAYGGPVFAQLQITCSQAIRFGAYDACSNGKLTVQPNGSTSNLGCLVTITAAQPGQCILSTLGPGPSKSVKVSFAVNFINITNGTSNVKIDSFQMRATTGTKSAAKATFSPTQVTNTVTLNVGARMNYNDNQAIGNYTGNITINAN